VRRRWHAICLRSLAEGDLALATTIKKPFWKRGNPNTRHRKLTEAQRRRARELARRAGRHYPNLIDNARVAREANEN
jgi:hypothetical protein